MKKNIFHIYISIILTYLIICTINLIIFFYVLRLEFYLIWLNFSIITFLFTLYAWIHGVITKSISLKILLHISKKNKEYKINEITNKIVNKEFHKRIEILKKNKLVYFKKGFFKLSDSGISKNNFILKLRKLYSINTKNFYF